MKFFKIGKDDGDAGALQDLKEVYKALDRVRAIVWFDLDGTIRDANATFLETVGYSLDEIRGKSHSMFVPETEAGSQAYRDQWARLRNGECVSGEFRRITRNGDTIWIQGSYNPIAGPDGKPAKIMTFCVDITESKLKSADASGQLDAISKAQAVIQFDLDGTIRTANENFCDTVGYALHEIAGKHHSMFVDPSEAAGPDYAAFWKELAAGEYKSGEFKRVGKGGREVWIQATYNPIHGPDGKPYKVVKYATDITRSKLAAADAQGQLAAIGRSQAVIEFDPDGTIRTANRNFLDAMGYSLDDIRGKHHRMFVWPDYAKSERYREFWTSIIEGTFNSGVYKRFGKDGREVWIQATYNPIYGPDGKLFKVVKYATEVSDLMNATKLIGEGLEVLSNGDLSVRMPETLTGEFERLRDAFNTTLERLGELVANILQTSETIAQQSDGIASTAKDLSSRGERQAATVEETSAATEELSATVKSNAANADGANEAAGNAANHAREGGAVVREAIAAMGRIETSAAEIGKIIQVIDSIAFQTNLLALNAGVEAARAGDAGRGFAVVAQEVRALAQRASEAAKDINELVASSSKEVAEGSGLVNKSGEALGQIVEAVERVVDSIGDITTASREQAVGISEITNAMSDIDTTTQHTAALSEESAAAATELAARAAELRSLVGYFHGTPATAAGQASRSRSEPVPKSAPVALLKVAGGGGAAAIAAPEPLDTCAEAEGWDEF